MEQVQVQTMVVLHMAINTLHNLPRRLQEFQRDLLLDQSHQRRPFPRQDLA